MAGIKRVRRESDTNSYSDFQAHPQHSDKRLLLVDGDVPLSPMEGILDYFDEESARSLVGISQYAHFESLSRPKTPENEKELAWKLNKDMDSFEIQINSMTKMMGDILKKFPRDDDIKFAVSRWNELLTESVVLGDYKEEDKAKYGDYIESESDEGMDVDEEGGGDVEKVNDAAVEDVETKNGAGLEQPAIAINENQVVEKNNEPQEKKGDGAGLEQPAIDVNENQVVEKNDEPQEKEDHVEKDIVYKEVPEKVCDRQNDIPSFDLGITQAIVDLYKDDVGEEITDEELSKVFSLCKNLMTEYGDGGGGGAGAFREYGEGEGDGAGAGAVREEGDKGDGAGAGAVREEGDKGDGVGAGAVREEGDKGDGAGAGSFRDGEKGNGAGAGAGVGAGADDGAGAGAGAGADADADAGASAGAGAGVGAGAVRKEGDGAGASAGACDDKKIQSDSEEEKETDNDKEENDADNESRKEKQARKKTKSRALCSPYAQREVSVAGSLKNLEKRIANWIFSAQGEMWEWLFEYDSMQVNVSRVQFESLYPGTYIDASVMSCWCLVLNDMERLTTPSSTKRFFLPCNMMGENNPNNKMEKEKLYEEFSENIENHLFVSIHNNLNIVDMVFFPLLQSTHYYVVCFNLKNKCIEVMDNMAGKLNAEKEKCIGILRYIFMRYLAEKWKDLYRKLQEGIKGKAVKTLKMKWKTADNYVDCGVFTMRHLETYKGQSVKNWDIGIEEESRQQKSQLNALRVKYLAKMITSDLNELISNNMKLLKKYEAKDEAERKRLRLLAADSIKQRQAVY